MGSTIGRSGGLRRVFARKQKVPTKQPPKAPQTLADPIIHEADTPLLTRLKDTYVSTSSAVVSHENPFASERMKKSSNLPQDRSSYTDSTFTVAKSSAGFLTYPEVLEILNRRESEGKETWTAHVVAEKYGIDPVEAANLLKYFSTYKQI